MNRLGKALRWTLGSLLLIGCQAGPIPESAEPQNVSRLAELYTQLGIGYLREGKYDIASRRLNRALELEPKYATAHHAMALLQEQLSRPKESELHYRRAIELDPTDSEALNNYGRFLCAQERLDEAETHFLQAVANPLYETPQAAFSNAGVCLFQAGDLDRAETYLRRALQADPKLPTALLTMAELSLTKQRPLPARAYLQRYLEGAPHSPRSLWLGIQVERELGDRSAASSYALLLKANYPDAQETRLLLESEQQ
jgi:type IV pilus assembly protein PilF